jgi:hypothetical protein
MAGMFDVSAQIVVLPDERWVGVFKACTIRISDREFQ